MCIINVGHVILPGLVIGCAFASSQDSRQLNVNSIWIYCIIVISASNIMLNKSQTFLIWSAFVYKCLLFSKRLSFQLAKLLHWKGQLCMSMAVTVHRTLTTLLGTTCVWADTRQKAAVGNSSSWLSVFISVHDTLYTQQSAGHTIFASIFQLNRCPFNRLMRNCITLG